MKLGVPLALGAVAAAYGFTQLSPEQQTELIDSVKAVLPPINLPALPEIAIPEQLSWAADKVKSLAGAVLDLVKPKAAEPAPAPEPAAPGFNSAAIIIPGFVAGVAIYAYATTPEGQKTVKDLTVAAKAGFAKASAAATKGVQQLQKTVATMAEKKPAAKPAAKVAEAPKKAPEPEKKAQPAAPKVDVAATAKA